MSHPDAPSPAAIPDRGQVDRSRRVRIEIGGPDRAKFLHNLVTNEVKKLAEGRGCEAFVTTPQGKTLSYVTLEASSTSILMRTDSDAEDTLVAHLRKYGIFDDVTIEVVSDVTFEVHVFGPSDAISGLTSNVEGLADAPLANVRHERGGHTLWWIREAPTGRLGVTIVGPREAEAEVREEIARAGFGDEVDATTFEAMRIEAGTPVSGRDVTPNNLPQEVGRDSATISFVKGCYLGQETVARLDALGHVNKILKGLRIEGTLVPKSGSSLTAADGKAAGTITSAVSYPGRDESIALAYVRVAHANAGTSLTVDVDGKPAVAVVADLPMGPGTRR